ncbi:hypothetical protein [Paraliomyxa miuraensis]|uniref:hypothetical protein n=1 Tax=Paraliomyxa miuraensis TaxID=376150 RepID=UPI00224E24E8|nr:hypothetical protein [Paraliomyxa miuraensis]MCX4247384.1 hypothetical protein [Paraliomyxa miuraensis]
MRTITKLSSPLTLALLLATACTPEATSTPNPPESAPSLAASEPTPASAPAPASEAAPEPAPAPEPEPAPEPVAPNAEPASLRLAFHGKCDYIDVSTVDDQTFVHYRSNNKDHLLRLGASGELIEPIPVGFEDQWHDAIDHALGRWPDQLLVMIESDARDGTWRWLYRQTAEGWKQIKTLGEDTNYHDAWPWIDGSILAHVETGMDEGRRSRLAVVRGEGKGPSLAKVQRAGKCEPYELYIADVAVLADGTVMASVDCNDAWVATWRPGDREGTVKRFSGDDYYTFHFRLDDQGRGFVLSGTDLLRWSDGDVTAVEPPKGRGQPEFDARNGVAWVVRGDQLWRHGEAGWEAIPTPEGRRIGSVAGLEHGTPWLRFRDDTVAMQTTDGMWHDVPLPPAPESEQSPKVVRLDVIAPGDAWIASKYVGQRKGAKSRGTKLRALYTTRAGATPQVCGEQEA